MAGLLRGKKDADFNLLFILLSTLSNRENVTFKKLTLVCILRYSPEKFKSYVQMIRKIILSNHGAV